MTDKSTEYVALTNHTMLKPSLSIRSLLTAGLCLLTLGVMHQARANTFVVTSTDNVGGDVCGTACTLGQAIDAANANSDSDTIVFDPTVFASKHTIEGAYGIVNDVSIIGPTMPGAGVTLCGEFRVDKGDLTLSNLNVVDGKIGLLVIRGHTTLNNCTFSGHQWAIFNVSLQHGTLTEEERKIYPGRFYAVLDEASTITANNCTIAGNGYGATNQGGLIVLNSCTVTRNACGIVAYGSNCTQTLSNCLVVRNSLYDIYNTINEPSTYIIDRSSITSGTAEAAGLDPKGLQDNGGPTPTIALVTSGSALGTGQTTLTTDQRGAPRSKTNTSDVGAYQTQPQPCNSTSTSSP